MKTITTKGLNPHTFEIVDHVPSGFMIWNIPVDDMNGYLPLCEMMDPTNKKDFSINPDTLKAIKVDDNEALVKASFYGACTLKKQNVKWLGLRSVSLRATPTTETCMLMK